MKRVLLLIILIFSGVFLSACNPLAKKAKSGLQVQITDSVAASVYLDGAYVEKTPFINKELKPGEYILKIQPDDPKLIPYETKISLKPGLLSVVTWQLAERPELSGGVIYEMEQINSKQKSEISFVTIPDGAIVTIAGQEKVFAPVILPDINPGHTEFEVSLPSYGTQKHTINVIPGYRMIITVKLAKENLTATQTENNSETEQQATDSATLPTTSPAPANPDPTAQTNSATNSATPTATGQKVQIKATNFFVEGKEVLRVRDLPNSSGKELGFAEVGSIHLYLGVTQGGWYNIQFNGQTGWVNTQYAQLVQ